VTMRPIKATGKGNRTVNPLAPLIAPPTASDREKLKLYYMKKLGYSESKAARAAGL
jgi:hypothetical protein